MNKFSKEQRIVLLHKIIDYFNKFSYQEDKDGCIIHGKWSTFLTVCKYSFFN